MDSDWNIDWIRACCLSLPDTTEDIQWDTILFRIARKIYLLVSPDRTRKSLICFKCTPEEFGELIEMDGIIPAPYLARNHWVAMTRLDALPRAEVRSRIRQSYDLVRSRLPKRALRGLSSAAGPEMG
jgi:predicted DNA-binding protein (MmcQ/YjbR family)